MFMRFDHDYCHDHGEGMGHGYAIHEVSWYGTKNSRSRAKN